MNADLARKAYSEGYNYFFGKNGYPLDYRKAFESFSISADAGSPLAMYAIGTMYNGGNYVNQDYKEAYNWFLKAIEANSNLSCAYSSLSELFYFGRGVEKDYNSALEFCLKAIELAKSQNNEAKPRDCLMAGELLAFVFKRPTDAFAYFYEAAINGNYATAWHNLGYLCRERLIPGENRDTAFKYFMKGAELGNPESMYEVGRYYIEKLMYDEGIPWVEKSAAGGCALAQKNLKTFKRARAAKSGSSILGMFFQ